MADETLDEILVRHAHEIREFHNRKVIEAAKPGGAPRLSLSSRMDYFVEFAAKAHGLTSKQVMQKTRQPHIVAARYMAYHLAYKDGFSFPQIGRFFGYDHTTIMHGVCSHEAKMAREVKLLPHLPIMAE